MFTFEYFFIIFNVCSYSLCAVETRPLLVAMQNGKLFKRVVAAVIKSQGFHLMLHFNFRSTKMWLTRSITLITTNALSVYAFATQNVVVWLVAPRAGLPAHWMPLCCRCQSILLTELNNGFNWIWMTVTMQFFFVFRTFLLKCFYFIFYFL